LSFHGEKVPLLYDSNHFHSQYILICVFLLQVRGKLRKEAATACASSRRMAFVLSSCHKLCWWARTVQLISL